MTFKHKLSRRLALLRGVYVATACAAVACNDRSISSPVTEVSSSSAITTSFNVGDRVKTTGTANVRSGPTGSSSLLGAQPIGALGYILGGPIVDSTGDKLTRFNVNFDNAPDGWVAQEYAALTLVTAAPPPATPAAPTVASVVVSPATVSIAVGATSQLAAAAKDSAGNTLSGQTIAWASSATAIATVSASGLVTAVSAGSATITASDAGKSGSAAITVTAAPAPPATPSFFVGGRVQAGTTGVNVRSCAAGSCTLLGAQAAGAQGTIVAGPVVDSTGDKLTRWNVNFDAGVDGWAAQDYMVALSSPSSPPPPPPAPASVASVTLSPKPASVIVGKTMQLTAVAKDSAGNTLSGAGMTWLSRDTLFAKVSASGLVTAVAIGGTYVLASSNGKSDSSLVQVLAVPVASVAVSPSSASLAPAATMQLVATAKDSAGNTITGRTVTWGSSNTAVATVSSAGMATAMTAGSATASATVGGKTGSSALTVTSATVVHKGWYAASNGSSGASGSITSPWDLATALSGGSGRVQPGDTVWVRAGTYFAPFRSTLTGTASAPIVVRNYNGERAIVDGVNTTSDNFTVAGSYSVFWGLEFTNNNPSRYTSDATSHSYRADDVVNDGPHNKYVNLIIHDGGVAFYTYSSTPDVTVYGSIIYDNGWDSSDRGHGHALYLKNDNGPVLAQDNVIFNQFGYGIHMYTNTGDGLLNGISAIGNVSFDNGSLSALATSANLGNLGQPLANNMQIMNNMTYFAPGLSGTNMTLGSGSGLTATGNYVVGGAGLSQGSWTGATIGSNTVLSSLSSLLSPKVFVRPNQFEAGRANVIVYNSAVPAASVSVDLSGVLNVGDSYVVRNVQDLWGAPVVSGTYGGGSISIPMSGVTPPVPVGLGSSRAPRTGPYFDVFIVTKN